MVKKYLLDTNTISEVSNPFGDEKVVEKINRHVDECVICSIVWYELLKGVKLLPAGKKKEYLEKYIFADVATCYEIFPYDKSCADVQSDIFAKLKEAGKPTPYADTQIAAVALANDLILVTRNTDDFSNIAEHFPLKIENWFL